MSSSRSVFVHAGLAALAAVAAVSFSMKDETAKVIVHEATVLNARPADIQQVTFVGKAKTVTIEPRKDEIGAFYFGTIEKPAPPSDASAQPSRSAFVSIGTGEKFFRNLAPLKALRDAGQVPSERLAELGLETPEATLKLKLASGERTFDIGGATPGGTDRYLRDSSSSRVYVVAGEIVRDLEWAESRLLERELHAWKESEIQKAKLVASGKTREVLRRTKEGKTFWADAASPDTTDETIGNFMQRLDRLRPSEYQESLPESRETLVRVELDGKSGPLGWVELTKVPREGDKADYFIRSELTRLYGKVVASLAQQVEQDIASVVR